MVKSFFTSIGLLVLIGGTSAFAEDLTEADFLADMPTVLTASRLNQSIMDAPSAVTVVDHETIAASGYTRLIDLFRLVPGMFVGEKTSSWVVATHGFADEYARRMQVLVDGRSIYLPTFGGVRWDTLPLLIEDIERIEVVRGPNASSYGANAFTGIINIITRHPDDVAGRLLKVVNGNEGQREGWFRWAGSTPQASHRITIGGREDAGMPKRIDDAFARVIDYRGDFRLSAGRSLTVQMASMSGAHLDDTLTRQEKTESRALQIEYGQLVNERNSLAIKLSHSSLDTSDGLATVSGLDMDGLRWHLEGQWNSQPTTELRTTLGAYLRQDAVEVPFYMPGQGRREIDSGGLFGHLEWRLHRHWLLNAGLFVEHYALVGDRASPQLAINWQPSEQQTLRLDATRAYRNPLLLEETADARVSPIPYCLLCGTDNLRPESIDHLGLGWIQRWPAMRLTWSLDVARDWLDDYIGFKVSPPPAPYTSVPGAPKQTLVNNYGKGVQTSYETQVKWQPAVHTQAMLNYAEFHIDSRLTNDDKYQLSAPRHQAGLHLMHTFSGKTDIAISHYWMGAVAPIGETRPSGFYRRLDVSLGKTFRFEGGSGRLGLAVQNLGNNYDAWGKEPKAIYDRRMQATLSLDF